MIATLSVSTETYPNILFTKYKNITAFFCKKGFGELLGISLIPDTFKLKVSASEFEHATKLTVTINGLGCLNFESPYTSGPHIAPINAIDIIVKKIIGDGNALYILAEIEGENPKQPPRQ